MFAADAGLWELNRFLPVTNRFYSSCKNRRKMKMAIQGVMVQHDFQRLAREASAAQAASFKSDYPLAISRIDEPEASPREMSSSTSSERRRTAGTIPPCCDKKP